MKLFSKVIAKLGTAIVSRMNKSEMWFPAGVMQFSTGKVYVGNNVNLRQQIVDIAASCIEVRAETRSCVTATITGRNKDVAAQLFFKAKEISTFAEFINLVSQDLDTHGNSFWYFDNLEVHRWNPEFVVVNIKDGAIVTYQQFARTAAVAPKAVFHFKRTSNLFNAILGRSKYEEVSALLYANTSLNQFFGRYLDTDCVPSVSIELPTTSVLSPEQIETMKLRYMENDNVLTRKQNVKFLWGGATAKALNHEMDFLKSYDVLFAAILRGFRVPRIVLGDTHDVNFSNGLTSYLIFLDLVVDKFLFRLGTELSYFFQSNKIQANVTFSSTIDPSRLSGLTNNTDPFTKVGVQPSAGEPALDKQPV